MKRLSIFLLVCFLMTLLLPVCAQADTAGTLVLPSSLKTIEAEAFRNDTSLDTVALPHGMLSIGSYAFAGSSVRRINLPSTITSIADNAFSGCSSALTVSVSPGSYAWDWCLNHGINVGQTITLGTTTAVIRAAGEGVLYRLVPASSDSYTLQSTGTADTYATLYDASGNVLTYDDDSGEGYNFSITYDLTAGSVYYYEVRYYSSSATGSFDLLLSCENIDAQITSDPVSLTVAPNKTATFQVTATGHSLSYQWQILLSGATDWENTTLNGCRTSTLSFTALQSHDGAQFRCAVTGNDGITVYSNPARLFVTTDSTRYRALLISEVNFDPICNRNQGDVVLMTSMLNNVRGPSGGTYSITTGMDYTPAQVQNAIASTFGEATSQDVSLFFIATHGDTYFGAGSPYAGALATCNGDSILFRDLASWLNAVPGKVIVIVESCGSGAGIYANNAQGSSSATDAQFCQQLIDAFAEIDSGIKSVDPNTGELRIADKFYVLTASALQQTSWGIETGPFNYFTKWLTEGIGTSGSIPADTNYGNSDGIVTLHELYSYISAVGDSYPFTTEEGTFYQTVKYYPENSGYQLFKRSA